MEFEHHHSGSAIASVEQQRSSAFERLKALLYERVEIRWSAGSKAFTFSGSAILVLILAVI
jgi:hypothetical protein